MNALERLIEDLSTDADAVESNVGSYFGAAGAPVIATLRATVSDLARKGKAPPAYLIIDPTVNPLSSSVPFSFANEASIFVEDAESDAGAEAAAARVLAYAVQQPDLLPLRALVLLAQVVCEQSVVQTGDYFVPRSALRIELQRCLPLGPKEILVALNQLRDDESAAMRSVPPMGKTKSAWRVTQASSAPTWMAQRRLLLELLFWVIRDAATCNRGEQMDPATLNGIEAPWGVDDRKEFLRDVVAELVADFNFVANPTDVDQDCFQTSDVERIVCASALIDSMRNNSKLPAPALEMRQNAILNSRFSHSAAERAVNVAKRANTALVQLCAVSALGLASPKEFSYARPALKDIFDLSQQQPPWSVRQLLQLVPWDVPTKSGSLSSIASSSESPMFKVLAAAALTLGLESAENAFVATGSGVVDDDCNDEAAEYNARLARFRLDELEIRASLASSSSASASSYLCNCSRELCITLSSIAASPSWMASSGKRTGGRSARAWPRAPLPQLSRSEFELGGVSARTLERELSRADSSDEEDQEAGGANAGSDDDEFVEQVDPLFSAAQSTFAHAVAAVLTAREYVRTHELSIGVGQALLSRGVQPIALAPIALAARREARAGCELRAVLALIRATHTTRDHAVFFWHDMVNPFLAALRAARVSFPAMLGPLCTTLRALSVSDAEYADRVDELRRREPDSTNFLLLRVRSRAVRSWAIDGAWAPNSPVREKDLHVPPNSILLDDTDLSMAFLPQADSAVLANIMWERDLRRRPHEFWIKMLCPVPFGQRDPFGNAAALPFPTAGPQTFTQVRPRPNASVSAPRELGLAVDVTPHVISSYSIMHCSKCNQLLPPAEKDPAQPQLSWGQHTRVIVPSVNPCVNHPNCRRFHQAWAPHCGHYFCAACAQMVHDGNQNLHGEDIAAFECPACQKPGALLPHTEVFLLDDAQPLFAAPLAVLLCRLLRADADAGITMEALLSAHTSLTKVSNCALTAETLFELDSALNQLAPRARELMHTCGAFADALCAKRNGRARRAMLKRLTDDNDVMNVVFDGVELGDYANRPLGDSIRESLLLERLADAAGRALDWLLPLAARAADMGPLGAADDDMVDDSGGTAAYDDIGDEDAADDCDDVDFASSHLQSDEEPTGWRTRAAPLNSLGPHDYRQWPPAQGCWPASRVDRATGSRPITHDLRYSAMRSLRAVVLASTAVSELFSLLCCDFTGVAAAAALAHSASSFGASNSTPLPTLLGPGTGAGALGSRAFAPRVVVLLEYSLAVAHGGEAAPALALSRATRAVIAEARARVAAPAAAVIAALRNRDNAADPLPALDKNAFSVEAIADAIISVAIARAGAGGALFSGTDSAAYRARVSSATLASPFPNQRAGAASAVLNAEAVRKRVRAEPLSKGALRELYAQLLLSSPKSKLIDCACETASPRLAPAAPDFPATFCRRHVSVWANAARAALTPGAKPAPPAAALPVTKKDEEDRKAAAAELSRFVAAALGTDADAVSLIASARAAARAAAPVAAAAITAGLPDFPQTGASARLFSARLCLATRATKILSLLADTGDAAFGVCAATDADIFSAYGVGARGALAAAAAPGFLSASSVLAPRVPRTNIATSAPSDDVLPAALPLLDIDEHLKDAFGANSHEFRWVMRAAERGARLLPRLLHAAGSRLPLVSTSGASGNGAPALLTDRLTSRGIALDGGVRGGAEDLSPVSALLALCTSQFEKLSSSDNGAKVRAGAAPAYAIAAMLRRAGRDAGEGARAARKGAARIRAAGRAYAYQPELAGPDDPDGFDTPLRTVVDEDAGGASGSGSEGEDDCRDHRFPAELFLEQHIRSLSPLTSASKCAAGFSWAKVNGDVPGFRCTGGSHFVSDIDVAHAAPRPPPSQSVHWILLIDRGDAVRDRRRDIFDVYRSILESRCDNHRAHQDGECNDVISVISLQTPAQRDVWPREGAYLTAASLCSAPRKSVPMGTDPAFQMPAPELADGLRMTEAARRLGDDRQVIFLLFTGAVDPVPGGANLVSNHPAWGNVARVAGAAGRLAAAQPQAPKMLSHIFNFGADNDASDAAGYDGGTLLENIERHVMKEARSCITTNLAQWPGALTASLTNVIAPAIGVGFYHNTLQRNPALMLLREMVDVRVGTGACIAAVVAAHLSMTVTNTNAAGFGTARGARTWLVHYGAPPIIEAISFILSTTVDWLVDDITRARNTPVSSQTMADGGDAPKARFRSRLIDRGLVVPEHVVDDARRSRLSLRRIGRAQNLDSDDDFSDASESSESETEDAALAVGFSPAVANFSKLCEYTIFVNDLTVTPPQLVECSLTTGLRALLFGGPADCEAAIEDARELAGRPNDTPPVPPKVPTKIGLLAAGGGRACCSGGHGSLFEPLRGANDRLGNAERKFRDVFAKLADLAGQNPGAVGAFIQTDVHSATQDLLEHAELAERFDGIMQASFSVVVAAATQPSQADFVRLLLAPMSKSRCKRDPTCSCPRCQNSGTVCLSPPDAVISAMSALVQPDCDAGVGGARALAALLRLRRHSGGAASVLNVIRRVEDVAYSNRRAHARGWWFAAREAMCDYHIQPSVVSAASFILGALPSPRTCTSAGRLLLHPTLKEWLRPHPEDLLNLLRQFRAHVPPGINLNAVRFVWDDATDCAYRRASQLEDSNRDAARTRLLRRRAAFVDLVAAAVENSHGPEGQIPALNSVGDFSIDLLRNLDVRTGDWLQERRWLAVGPRLDLAAAAADDSSPPFRMARDDDAEYVFQMDSRVSQVNDALDAYRVTILAYDRIQKNPPANYPNVLPAQRQAYERELHEADQNQSACKMAFVNATNGATACMRALLADCSDALGNRRALAEDTERKALIAAGIDPSSRGVCGCSGSHTGSDCATRLADVLGLGSAWRAERSRDRRMASLVYGSQLQGYRPDPRSDDFQQLFREEISATIATLTHPYTLNDPRAPLNVQDRCVYGSRTRAAFTALGAVASACHVRALESASARGALAVSRLFSAVRVARRARWHTFNQYAVEDKLNHDALSKEYSIASKGDGIWPTQSGNTVFLCATRAAALAGGPSGAVTWARAAADAAAYDGPGGGPPLPRARAFALSCIAHTLNSLDSTSAGSGWTDAERVAVGAALCAAARALVPRAPSPARWAGPLFPEGAAPRPRHATAYPKSWPFDELASPLDWRWAERVTLDAKSGNRQAFDDAPDRGQRTLISIENAAELAATAALKSLAHGAARAVQSAVAEMKTARSTRTRGASARAFSRAAGILGVTFSSGLLHVVNAGVDEASAAALIDSVNMGLSREEAFATLSRFNGDMSAAAFSLAGAMPLVNAPPVETTGLLSLFPLWLVNAARTLGDVVADGGGELARRSALAEAAWLGNSVKVPAQTSVAFWIKHGYSAAIASSANRSPYPSASAASVAANAPTESDAFETWSHARAAAPYRLAVWAAARTMRAISRATAAPPTAHSAVKVERGEFKGRSTWRLTCDDDMAGGGAIAAAPHVSAHGVPLGFYGGALLAAAAGAGALPRSRVFSRAADVNEASLAADALVSKVNAALRLSGALVGAGGAPWSFRTVLDIEQHGANALVNGFHTLVTAVLARALADGKAPALAPSSADAWRSIGDAAGARDGLRAALERVVEGLPASLKPPANLSAMQASAGHVPSLAFFFYALYEAARVAHYGGASLDADAVAGRVLAGAVKASHFAAQPTAATAKLATSAPSAKRLAISSSTSSAAVPLSSASSLNFSSATLPTVSNAGVDVQNVARMGAELLARGLPVSIAACASRLRTPEIGAWRDALVAAGRALAGAAAASEIDDSAEPPNVDDGPAKLSESARKLALAEGGALPPFIASEALDLARVLRADARSLLRESSGADVLAALHRPLVATTSAASRTHAPRVAAAAARFAAAALSPGHAPSRVARAAERVALAKSSLLIKMPSVAAYMLRDAVSNIGWPACAVTARFVAETHTAAAAAAAAAAPAGFGPAPLSPRHVAKNNTQLLHTRLVDELRTAALASAAARNRAALVDAAAAAAELAIAGHDVDDLARTDADIARREAVMAEAGLQNPAFSVMHHGDASFVGFAAGLAPPRAITDSLEDVFRRSQLQLQAAAAAPPPPEVVNRELRLDDLRNPWDDDDDDAAQNNAVVRADVEYEELNDAVRVSEAAALEAAQWAAVGGAGMTAAAWVVTAAGGAAADSAAARAHIAPFNCITHPSPVESLKKFTDLFPLHETDAPGPDMCALSAEGRHLPPGLGHAACALAIARAAPKSFDEPPFIARAGSRARLARFALDLTRYASSALAKSKNVRLDEIAQAFEGIVSATGDGGMLDEWRIKLRDTNGPVSASAAAARAQHFGPVFLTPPPQPPLDLFSTPIRRRRLIRRMRSRRLTWRHSSSKSTGNTSRRRVRAAA